MGASFGTALFSPSTRTGAEGLAPVGRSYGISDVLRIF